MGHKRKKRLGVRGACIPFFAVFLCLSLFIGAGISGNLLSTDKKEITSMAAADLTTGTAANPIMISTVEQLRSIGFETYSNDGKYYLKSGYYKLEQNITINTGFLPTCREGSAGTYGPFTGTFDGNGKTITIGGNVTTATDNMGIIGYAGAGAIFKDVNVNVPAGVTLGGENVDYVGVLVGTAGQGARFSRIKITGKGTITGRHYIAGMVGYAMGGNTIEDCSSEPNVVATGNYVGGLVGYTYGASVQRNKATGNVSGISYIGGLSGYIGQSSNAVFYNYATGNVVGDGNYVGGFVGCASGAGTTFYYNYATGTVSGSGTYVGGFLGYSAHMTVRYNYSTGAVTGANCVGGFLGSIEVSSSIYDNYSLGNVTITGAGSAGSFAGRSYFSAGNAEVYRCFSLGSVTSTVTSGDIFIGGFIGRAFDSPTTSGTYYTLTLNTNISAASRITTQTSGNKYIGNFVGYRGNVNLTISNYDYYNSALRLVHNGASSTPANLGGQTAVGSYTNPTLVTSFSSFSTLQSGWDNTIWEINGGYPKLKSSLFVAGAENAPATTHNITTRAQLEAIGSKTTVNGEVYNTQDTYILKANISIAAGAWNPSTKTNEFNGVLDGGGFTVTVAGNITANADYFGIIGRGARFIVRDLTVNIPSGVIFNGSSYANVGALVGYGSQEILTNCHVTGRGTVRGGTNVGGVAGLLSGNSDVVKSCSSTVDVDGTVANVDVSSGVGGFVGYAGIRNITDCWASGNVTSVGSNVGGFMGWNNSSSNLARTSAYGNVKGLHHVGGHTGGGSWGVSYYDSFAYGNVTATGSHASSYQTAYAGNAGGFIGLTSPAGASNHSFVNCYAAGNVTNTAATGYVDVGGFLGYNSVSTATPIAGYNNSTDIFFYNCAVLSKSVTATSANKSVGSLVGYKWGEVILAKYGVRNADGTHSSVPGYVYINNALQGLGWCGSSATNTYTNWTGVDAQPYNINVTGVKNQLVFKAYADLTKEDTYKNELGWDYISVWATAYSNFDINSSVPAGMPIHRPQHQNLAQYVDLYFYPNNGTSTSPGHIAINYENRENEKSFDLVENGLVPSLTGWKFEGWFSGTGANAQICINPNGDIQTDLFSKLRSAKGSDVIFLYARWTAKLEYYVNGSLHSTGTIIRGIDTPLIDLGTSIFGWDFISDDWYFSEASAYQASGGEKALLPADASIFENNINAATNTIKLYARTSCTITYVIEGDNSFTETRYYGMTYNAPTNIVNGAWQFGGWFKSYNETLLQPDVNSGVITNISTTDVTGNRTLYARWFGKVYFSVGGTITDERLFTKGVSRDLPVAVYPAGFPSGWSFQYWCRSSDFSPSSQFNQITSTESEAMFTVYARLTRQFNYDYNFLNYKIDGFYSTGALNITLVYGGDYTLVDIDWLDEWWVFDGWYTQNGISSGNWGSKIPQTGAWSLSTNPSGLFAKLTLTTDYSELEKIIELAERMIAKGLITSSNTNYIDAIAAKLEFNPSIVDTKANALYVTCHNILKTVISQKISEFCGNLEINSANIPANHPWYTENSWNNFIASLNSSLFYNDQLDVTPYQLFDVYNQLVNSYNALTPEKEELQILISDAKKLKAVDFPAEAFQIFSSVVSLAEGILDNNSATVNQVQNAISNMISATLSLNKAKLNELVSNGDTIYNWVSEWGEYYTDESWSSFIVAYNSAKIVSANPSATLGSIQTQITLLSNAITGLEFDIDKLYDLIELAEAEVLRAELYTQASIIELEKAIEFAKNITTDEDVPVAFQWLVAALSELATATELYDRLLIMLGQIGMLSSQDYTVLSWTDLQDMLSFWEAQHLSYNSDPTVLFTANNQINAARNALVYIKELKTLLQEITAANYKAIDFTSLSFSALQSALNSVSEKSLLQSGTDIEVANAIQQIKNARSGLVNIAALKALLSEVASEYSNGNYNITEYYSNDYTTATFNNLQSALDSVKSASLLNNGTAAEVSSAISNISNARTALVYIKTLKDIVSIASQIERGDYLSQTHYQNLELYLSSSDLSSLYANGTSSAVSTRTTNIQNAINNIHLFFQSTINSYSEANYTEDSFAKITYVKTLLQTTLQEKVNYIVEGQKAIDGLIDIAKLKNLVNTAREINNSWDTFNNKLLLNNFSAFTALLNEVELVDLYMNGTAAQLTERINAIESAIGTFVSTIESVFAASPYNLSSNFTSNSYTAVVQALNLPRTTAAERVSFISASQKAISGLIDVRVLRTLLNSVAGNYASGNFIITAYLQNNFTTASFTNLQNRLNVVNTQHVLDSGTSAQIQQMINDITEAKDGLVSVVFNGNNLRDLLYVECHRTISEPDGEIPTDPEESIIIGGASVIENIGDKKYSVESWTTFVLARYAAIAAINNGTESQIQEAIYNLMQATESFRYSQPIRLNHLKALYEKSEYQEALGNAGIYTPGSYARFKKVMEDAYDAFIPYVGIDLAIGFNETIYYDLYEAFVSLRLVGDKSELNRIYDEMIARQYQQSYFIGGFNTFQNALLSAKSVIDDAEAIQSEIDFAVNTLLTAFAGLRVNLTDLNTLIQAGAGYSYENYTESDWSSFAESFYNAQMADNTITYENYVIVLGELKAALKNLVLSDLQALYDRVKDYESKYFTNGYTAFILAFAYAEQTIENPDVTSYEVCLDRFNALDTAVKNLIVDLKELVRLVNAINANPEEYGSENFGIYYDDFVDALENAESALSKGSALSLEEYNETLFDLSSALSHRILNTSGLEDEIANALLFIQNNELYYSRSSIAELKNAIEYAETILNDLAIRQSEINAATLELNELLTLTQDISNLSGWYITNLISREVNPVRHTIASYYAYINLVDDAKNYVAEHVFTLEGVKDYIDKLLNTLVINYIDDNSENDTSDVDKSELYDKIINQDIITEDEYYNEYSEDSINTYNDYFNDILIPLFDNPFTTDEIIEQALKNLPGLIADKTRLLEIIAMGEQKISEIGINKFTQESLAEFQRAMQIALEVANDDTASVPSVRESALNLLNAMDNLEIRLDDKPGFPFIIIIIIIVFLIILSIVFVMIKRRKK